MHKYLTKKCEVIVVGGNSKERKNKYKEIYRNNLLNDVDGLYMESVNASLKSFDIKFLQKVRDANIPMSGFYRDIHWKFPVFSRTFLQKLKYKRKFNKSSKQLEFFKRTFDIIYSHTVEFAEFGGFDKKHLLPPGGEILEINRFDNEIGIFFSGSLKDGFENLLKANEILIKQNIKFNFYIITQIVSFDIPENFHVFPSITDEIINKVHFGIIPLKDTEYYRLTLSLKFMQYLAFGLPVICTSLPSFIKYDEMYNICKFYDGSAEDLAKKIIELSENKNLRETMSQNALRAVRENENWALRVETILNDFKNIRNRA